MNKKNILITGGLGFIGSNLVDFLVKKDEFNITVIDNLSSMSSSIKYKNKYADYIIDDVSNIENIKNDFDIIFHLAANARIQPSFENPFETINNNFMNTVILCNFALKNNSRIIMAGTSSIQNGYIKSPYTFSKWASENVLKLYNNVYKLQSSITRFFNVYGNREPVDGEYATVIRKFIRLYMNNESLTIVGNGEQMRDFTHIDDICEGLYTVYKNGKNDASIYNLGRGRPISINNISKLFPNCKVKYIDKRKGEGFKTECDYKKTFEQIGWKAKLNIEDYIKTILLK